MGNKLAHFLPLQQTLTDGQAMLLSAPADLAYFADFATLLPEEREGFFLITKTNCYLIKAAFSPALKNPPYQILEHCRPTALAGHLTQLISAHKLREIMFDATNLTVDEYQAMHNLTSQQNVQLSYLNKNLIWNLRIIKDASEIELMRQAGQIAISILEQIRTHLEIGVTEQHVARQIEMELLQRGAQRNAFPTIVAFGANGAAPHYQPGTLPLKLNTPVLIDMGVMVGGYRSDLTRSFWFGANPSADFLRIEKNVQDAYQAAVQSLHQSPLPTAQQVDQAARQTIAQQKLVDYFIHTTGHGLGLDIHEPPSLNSHNSQPLQTNMVITIEPGIYLPGQFGYRHENTIWLSAKGIEILTELPA